MLLYPAGFQELFEFWKLIHPHARVRMTFKRGKETLLFLILNNKWRI